MGKDSNILKDVIGKHGIGHTKAFVWLLLYQPASVTCQL